jgi:hypothetical protein
MKRHKIVIIHWWIEVTSVCKYILLFSLIVSAQQAFAGASVWSCVNADHSIYAQWYSKGPNHPFGSGYMTLLNVGKYVIFSVEEESDSSLVFSGKSDGDSYQLTVSIDSGLPNYGAVKMNGTILFSDLKCKRGE